MIKWNEIKNDSTGNTFSLKCIQWNDTGSWRSPEHLICGYSVWRYWYIPLLRQKILNCPLLYKTESRWKHSGIYKKISATLNSRIGEHNSRGVLSLATALGSRMTSSSPRSSSHFIPSSTQGTHLPQDDQLQDGNQNIWLQYQALEWTPHALRTFSTNHSAIEIRLTMFLT